jgi:hypothetical protein
MAAEEAECLMRRRMGVMISLTWCADGEIDGRVVIECGVDEQY